MAERRGLGRGLDSLIPTPKVATVEQEAPGKASGDSVALVSPDLIDPNPYQPRKNFNQEELEALAASIRVHGILQPMVVTRHNNRYQLIAGERRLRAAKLASLDEVPVIVRSFDEQQKLELAILENIQRSELNPMELAAAYRKLVDEFNMTVTAIAAKVGKDVSVVSNCMRLLRLPDEAKKAVEDGKIGEGIARVILSVPESEKQVHLLRLCLQRGWNTRQVEEYARAYKGETGSKMLAEARIAASNQMTMELGDILGTKVTQQKTAHGGKLIIEYYSEAELDRIYHAIRQRGR